MVTQIAGFKDRLLASYNGLTATWFDGWNSMLNEALQGLPEMDACPHELFRRLIQNPGSAPKKITLITKRGTAVAVVPLRQLGRWNYEIPNWMIPGALFPAQWEYLIPALEALGSEVWVSWRRKGDSPPQSQLMRYLKLTPLHLIRFSEDYESYWRGSGLYKQIRKTRNRCKDFELVVNSPGSAEWTIRNAAEKWRNESSTTSRVIDDWAVSDWIVVANYLESLGRHYTLMLLDKGSPIGGATLFVTRNEAVGGLIYRKPGYERFSVGVRLLDLCTSFAAESGFDVLDFGGNAEYKTLWAPQEGALYLFNLCPEPIFRVKQALNWARKAPGKVVNWVGGDQTPAS